MQPFWVSLGDYDSVLAARGIVAKGLSPDDVDGRLPLFAKCEGEDEEGEESTMVRGPTLTFAPALRRHFGSQAAAIAHALRPFSDRPATHLLRPAPPPQVEVLPGVKLPAHMLLSPEEREEEGDGAFLQYPLLQRACAGVSDREAAEEGPGEWDFRSRGSDDDEADGGAEEAGSDREEGEGEGAPPLDFISAARVVTNLGVRDSARPPWRVELPGASDAPEGANAPFPPGKLFHLDSKGNACFSREEAFGASALLYETGFLDAVQEKLNAVPFQLPQART